MTVNEDVVDVVEGEFGVTSTRLCQRGVLLVVVVVPFVVAVVVLKNDCECEDLLGRFELDKVMAGPSNLRFKTGGTSLLAEILICVHLQMMGLMLLQQLLLLRLLLLVGLVLDLLLAASCCWPLRLLRRGGDGGARLL